MRIKILFFCVFLFVFTYYSNAQVGKEFWFVAPDVTSGHGDSPIAIRITALDKPASVSIMMPANGTYIIQNQSILANSQVTIEPNKDDLENSPSNSINDKGIFITADEDITVYYEVVNGVNPDKFTLKGDNGLGREFYIPSQNIFRNKPLNPIADEKVDIVATQDNTIITIVPTADIVGHKADIPFTITLNKGQTFCLENRDYKTSSSSLAGTYISSDKNVAVTISDDSVWEEYIVINDTTTIAAGPYDLIGDQLIPTTVIGNEYIAINTSTDNQTVNKLFVLATEDDTYITINSDNSLVKGPLSKGEQIDLEITDNAIYVSSNYPVYTYQVASFWNKDGNEMGSAVLPSLTCTGSKTVSFVRSFNKKFYAQLLSQGGSIKSFVFKNNKGEVLDNLTNTIFDEEGNSYPDMNSIPWIKVKGTDSGNPDDTWYTAVVSLKITTEVPYTISNTNGLFHMSILDENQGSTSYGYFSSYGQLRLEGPNQECQGNVIKLSTSEPMKSYNWFSEHSGNTVLSTAPTLDVTQSGTYWVTAEVNFGGCELTDSLHVDFIIPEFDLGPDEKICPDETINIKVASGLGNYAWSDGTTSNETSLTLSEGQTQTISLTVTDDFNCSNTDTKEVSTYPLPIISLNKTEVCEGEKIINQTTLERYEWTYNGTLLNIDDGQNFIVPTQSGKYTLTAWGTNDCSVTENFDVVVRPLPTFDISDKLGCKAATTTINAPNGLGYSYNWSDGSTLNHIDVSTPSDLWLEITDQYGCVARDEFNFDYLPPASFDLGEDKEECAGITLKIDQGSDYSNFDWKFKKEGTTTIVDLPLPTPEYEYEIVNSTSANSGTYYLTATDINGCELADDVKVTFYEAANLSLTLSKNLCAGETISITTSQGYDTYTWYSDVTELTAFANQNKINVNTPGNYKVVAVYGGCTKTDDVTVTQHGNPNVQLINDFDICSNGEGVISVSSFNAVGSSSFDYLVWNGGIRRFNDWNTAKLNVNAAGVYTVTAYDIVGCKATDNITVGLYTDTNVGLVSPIETCEDIAVTLVNPIYNSLTYEWYKVDALGDIQKSINSNLVVNEPGSYRLRIDDVNGCEASDTVVVKTFPIPNVSLGADREMCVGDSIELETDATYNEYRWNDDPTLNKASILVNASGNYKVEVGNIYGCWSQDDVLISANPSPVFTLTDQSVCSGVNVQLTAPLGLMDFKWSTGETKSIITVSKGSYTLEAKSDKGCIGKATANVKWFDIPKVELGKDTFICPVDFIRLTANDGFDYYEWHNGSNARSILANFADTVNMVKVRDSNNCWGFDTRILKALPTPDYELYPDTAVCNGDSLLLEAGEGYAAYMWFDDTRLPTYSVRQPGEYWVKVLDGCFWLQDTTDIVYNETPVIARLDTSIFGQVVIFPEGGTEPYRYAINNEGWQEENVFENLENGTYDMQVEDVNTCAALKTITINSNIDIDVPNFFTPNNDGFNDTWEIDGMSKFPDSIIKIYDRFGKLLIKYKASDPGWNGEYLNKPVSSDAYWYVIEILPVKKYLKGHITLKR